MLHRTLQSSGHGLKTGTGLPKSKEKGGLSFHLSQRKEENDLFSDMFFPHKTKKENNLQKLIECWAAGPSGNGLLVQRKRDIHVWNSLNVVNRDSQGEIFHSLMLGSPAFPTYVLAVCGWGGGMQARIHVSSCEFMDTRKSSL